MKVFPLESFAAYSNVDTHATVYGKTFEWENFHGFRGFSANRKSFLLESFAVYST